MKTLYSYVVRTDTGAAPNPYGGICSLAICKPQIRRSARVGDWIAGTGSARSRFGDLSTRLVYAMRVTEKVSMADYDTLCRLKIPAKVPDPGTAEAARWVGDSIYDFRTDPPSIRPSVHSEGDRIRDLSGDFVLLSNHFFYFGRGAVEIPRDLQSIVKKGPGHRSRANDEILARFVDWVSSLPDGPGMHGEPTDRPAGPPVFSSGRSACA